MTDQDVPAEQRDYILRPGRPGRRDEGRRLRRGHRPPHGARA